MTYRIGIDIGGTFTDFAMIDDATGALSFDKILTTPKDPSLAVMEGLRRLLDTTGVSISQVVSIIHGSTLVTNAVIERKGAPTGMLVTAGFRDVLNIALERRYDLYDLRMTLPEPIIDRECRAEIHERLAEDGSVLSPLDLREVEKAVQALIDEHAITALAVCFLHSFSNPSHEQEAAAHITDLFPELYVTYSADVLPFMREYERWNTAAVNAYVRPLVDRYLGRLEGSLADLGFNGAFFIMTSSGGTVTSDIARRYPVRMLESGPAAGVLMAADVGRRVGVSDLLSFDMGGTTAKGSIVRGGLPRKKYEIEVARVHEYQTGSGLPVKIPVIDMIEIGAGGGGIAELDDRGLLRVGPRSAGADPGPACYGRGGENATLSDANLTLGYYDADTFLGGTMRLDRAASERAIRSRVASKLDLDLARAAWGIHETINEDVARAFRVHASDIGFDYRRCSMVAFGGSGPAHAARIARKLRVPKVIYPRGSGVMSAIGMLVSPLSFQLARSNRVALTALTAEAFAEYFAGLQGEAEKVLFPRTENRPNLTVRRSLDMRYQGQGYELEVVLPENETPQMLFDSLPGKFAAAYRDIFSLSYLDEPIEILNWKVEVIGPSPVAADSAVTDGTSGRAAPRATRQAYFPEKGYVECPVYDRYLMSAGDYVDGPAFVEERESTCVLGYGDRATIDHHGNLVAEIGGLS
ncbi:hydantoinase/oxoprolinase family protein [Microvirga antarctica]|uniref:hydantoinase/oxoprolinase family protein n=1 Tax=Microvirga antarctica TaxID=2819233 RepID=UPI001B30B43A|nr:hydantoinase/oxoprolinase family protein [Microvirga antarctica]